MRAMRKRRGATAISDGRAQVRPLRAIPKFLLAAVAVLTAMAASALLTNPNGLEERAQSIEPELASPRTPLEPPPQPAPAPVVAAPQPETPPQPWAEQPVKSGDNLSLIFSRAGFSDRDVHAVVSQAEAGKDLARIYPGQRIDFLADPDGTLRAVRHVKSPLESVIYRRTDSGFESDIKTRAPEVREAWASGVITSSLFMAGQDAGLSHNMIMELANIFGGVIDFVLDPRKGDTIDLVYEEMYLDGEKLRDGHIIAASFTNQGETFTAYRYVDVNGDVGYFNDEGVSMRKAFLLAPVDFTRISSNFNLRRLHPIYKTTRPHRGTDYAAPRGTPVFAAGDGRVVEAGYSRANGNYVFIRHGEQYVTKYLHLHKRHVRQGQRVAQSQVIGTVGSTGAATGPHLHYEFLMNGVHRNPRTIHKQLPKARSLPADELARFERSIHKASTQLAFLSAQTTLAMSGSAESDTATH